MQTDSSHYRYHLAVLFVLGVALFSSTLPLCAKAATTTPSVVVPSERVLKTMSKSELIALIGKLKARLASLEKLSSKGTKSKASSASSKSTQSTVTVDDVRVSIVASERLPGHSGSGYFDGESLLLLKITLENTLREPVKINTASLRLRDDDGAVFLPLVHSVLKDQPRYKNGTSGAVKSGLEIGREVNLSGRESLQGSIVFYMNKASVPGNYNLTIGNKTVPVVVK